MTKNDYVTKQDLEEILEVKFREKLEPVMNLLNTVLKEIQDFREESTIFRSLHRRVCDLEEIHPDNTHQYAQKFISS